MGCDQLEALRKDARETYAKLLAKIHASQDFSEAGEDPHSGKTDYEPFLRSRLAQVEMQIRGHLAQHHCE